MKKGRYGIYGGQYISETLMNELIHLEEQYEYYKKDPEFQEELHRLLVEYAGRPSLLYYAEKMTKDLAGTAGKEDGKDETDRRNRSRTAWCCNCNGSSFIRYGM